MEGVYRLLLAILIAAVVLLFMGNVGGAVALFGTLVILLKFLSAVQ